MELSDYVSRAANGLSSDVTSRAKSVADSLIKGDKVIGKYFSESVPDSEKERMRGSLEKIVNHSFDKYSIELNGFLRKGGTRGAMALALINDLSAYVTNVPIANVTGLGYVLFGVKTAIEAPAMYRYLNKSHDWYGALKHYALKPVNYLIPVVGAALEAGSFERMVRKRIRHEAKLEFIKENGDYELFDERFRKQLSTPLKQAVSVRPASGSSIMSTAA